MIYHMRYKITIFIVSYLKLFILFSIEKLEKIFKL